jgi:coenzyme F420-reducing hydrogenase gamma subunit
MFQPLRMYRKSGHDDIVDVAVVEGAIRRGDAIVTSNVTHIRKVAEAARAVPRIESVAGVA